MQYPLAPEAGRPLGVIRHVILVRQEHVADPAHLLKLLRQDFGEARTADRLQSTLFKDVRSRRSQSVQSLHLASEQVDILLLPSETLYQASRAVSAESADTRR